MKQAKKYPAPQISEAVFRGRNSLYNFEVYPMNVQFNEVPAVYIISKRKIDRYGRGHHFLVCIGQTESLVEDIKMHKRGKCVKQLQANTVSVILEDDAQKRLEVENDLKSAHVIPCHHDAAGAEFVLKPIEKAVSRKVKTEAKKIVPAPPLPPEETPAKPLKKPSKKPAEIKAEVQIEVPEPKKAQKAKKPFAPMKAKADSEKTNPSLKIQKVEKKPETAKSKKTAQTDKKIDATKIKTKAQNVKTQKAEVSKPKETSANAGKTKAGKKTPDKKIEASKPKKVSQPIPKIEKKTSTPKTVQASKKSSGAQIKAKAESQAGVSKLKRDAQKINKAKVDKAKAGKAKTVGTPKKPAQKTVNAKSPKPVEVSKSNVVNKAKTKVNISAEAKTGQKTGKAKAGADSKTPKTSKTVKTKQTKTSKITKPAQNNQAKVNQTKTKEKTVAPKSAKPSSPKVKANTKAEIGIKSSVKGKDNRLKTSSRKRLAF
ncbi:MAG TPA: hypothetical protein VF599_17485 [Pyrinomonadaceae bacterium]|jgi:hypothetical protein